MSKKDKDLEWKNRVLCSDESCIGVIGPDGQCKECGLAYQGELPDTFNLTSSEASSTHQASRETETEAAEDVEEKSAQQTPMDDNDDEWAKRTLCIDESCIGVVGPDGRCKECGKPYPT